MKPEEILSRIDATSAKIAKTEKTIERKQSAIAKETAVIVSEGFDADATFAEIHEAGNSMAGWSALTIESLRDDIRRAYATIADAEKLLRKYRDALITATADETIEVPDVLSIMEKELVRVWDEYDEARGERNHAQNVRDAHAMAIDLVKRVQTVTGTITDWSNVHAEQGNLGAVLNGYVIGTNGRAKVESVCAGGYNVQRLHIRTLVTRY